MKLTRKDLVRAQDTQLQVLGVKRKGNSGWLKKTLARDFAPDIVAMFHKVRRKTKADAPKSARPNRWERKPVVIDGIIMPDKDAEIQRLKAELSKVAAERDLLALSLAESRGSSDRLIRVMSDEKDTEWGFGPSPEDFANNLFEKTERNLA